jgi:hypothetical protein
MAGKNRGLRGPEIRELVQSDPAVGLIPQRWWEDLDEEGYLNEAKRIGKGGLARITQRAKVLIGLGAWRPGIAEARTGLTRPATTQLFPKPPKGKKDAKGMKVLRARSEILSKYLAKLAAESPRLAAFRKEHLKGVLSKEAALSFLNSPAVRFLPPREVQKLPIRISEVRSQLLHLGSERREERTLVWTARLEIVLDGHAREVVVRRTAPVAPGQPQPRLASFSMPQLGGETISGARHRRVLEYFRGSILDELRELGAELAQVFPWAPGEAVWFALTGAAPRVAPVEYGGESRVHPRYRRTLLRLDIEPWVPADAVRRAYMLIQREVIGRQRQPGLLNTSVFGFVVERMAVGGEVADWDALRKEWNELRGRSRQYAALWRFRRDFERGRDAIAFSGQATLPPTEGEEDQT